MSRNHALLSIGEDGIALSDCGSTNGTFEDGSIRRVGATGERRVDVPVVAATHQRLEELVAGGRFRQDLYFRLGAVVLEIPPLRERPREIPLLAARLAAEVSPTPRCNARGCTGSAAVHGRPKKRRAASSRSPPAGRGGLPGRF